MMTLSDGARGYLLTRRRRRSPVGGGNLPTIPLLIAFE
jgi:hypothetical protein